MASSIAKPVISVLLPVYNAAPYVAAAIESVLVQSFPDFELLVIDDGSTDATIEILQALAAQDQRIRLTSRGNRGLVATLNEMLAMAQGNLVCRMDADDLCRPDRLARQKSYLDAHPECVAVGSRSLFIDPEGLPIFEFMDRYTHEQIDEALMAPEIGILHPTLMARRAPMQALGGYRSGYPHVEDLDLFLRLAETGRLANLPDVLLDYRVHLGSVSHRHTVEQSAAGRNAVREACRRRGIAWDEGSRAALVAQPESTLDLHRKWAWWALGAGNRRTALKHAWHALRGAPTSRSSWQLLACALRP